MIKASFKENDLILDLSNLEKSNIWKDITFTLFYWLEVIWDEESSQYEEIAREEIRFEWETNLKIELDEIKEVYLGKKINISYYLEVKVDRKILWDKKTEVDIENINKIAKKYSQLESSDASYKKIKDEYSLKEIIKNFNNIEKLSLILWITLLIWWIVLFILYQNIILIIFWIIILIILFFLTWKWYIDLDIKANFREWNKLKSSLKWKMKVNEENLKIEVYVMNTEEAHFIHWSWSSTRRVDFDIEVWSILLYSKTIKEIKSWEDIADFIDYKIDLSDVYKKLFKEISISSDNKSILDTSNNYLTNLKDDYQWLWNMGLFLKAEIRIISEKFKDIIIREKIYPNNKFISKETNINESKEENSDFFS